jgi:hypothetical protein
VRFILSRRSAPKYNSTREAKNQEEVSMMSNNLQFVNILRWRREHLALFCALVLQKAEMCDKLGTKSISDGEKC